MKVRITQQLSGSIDGIQLDHFYPGHVYDIGATLGSVMLAEGWAEPVPDEEAPMAPADSDVAEKWGKKFDRILQSTTVHDAPRPPRKKTRK
ncbi:MAG: hypothetical protein HYZ58_12065 [Acidobacteria bacterium]|nr:hypothetical protein [Acidobacteriota bacterium]